MRTQSLRQHTWFSALSIKCRNNAATIATTPSPLHKNSSRQSSPPHNRQRHRKYLGNLLLSPPEKAGNHVFFYKTVHAQVILSGFETICFLNNILISAYSKVGALRTAAHLFDKMPQRSLISWSSMISAYGQNGHNLEALMLFMEFRKSGSDAPNEFVLSTVIQSSTRLASVENGMRIHGFVIKAGYNQNDHVGTSLIDFYAKTGFIDRARMVFDELGRRTVVAWTAIILGFSMNGRSDVSLDLFKEMVEFGVVPDKYAICCVLRVCLMLESLESGKQVHAFVLRNGANMDVSVGNGLIDLYSKCGELKSGERIFYQVMDKNVVSWTTMISAYMQNDFNYEAMDLFRNMIGLGWQADDFACASVLTSIGSVGAIDLGKQIHGYAVKVNLDSDDYVLSSLIDMYCKCNFLNDARRIFHASVRCNAICYNVMIEGYSRHRSVYETLELFNEMRCNSISPSELTFVSLLGAALSDFALEASKGLHSLIIRLGFSEDSYVRSALIGIYSKCSLLVDARCVFEEISDKDIAVWNSMLFGYALQSENEKAHELYLKLLQHGREKPNQYTFVAVIMASSDQASLLHGLQLHNQVIKMGLDSDPFVMNALMDMYSKCGSIDAAELLLNSMFPRQTACWNSIISMHAHHGNAEKALDMLQQMKSEGAQPNYITFVAVLSACAHAGLIEEGFHHFNSMIEFGIEQGEAHYSCMVSLLGRAGKLDQARSFIENMPMQPTATVWKSLLSACRVNSNVKLGQHAAEMAISSDPKDSGSYILLSNIFASKGMWMDAKEVRRKMECNALVKEPGCSWIEVGNQVHLFVARDQTHRNSGTVYSLLDHLIQHMKVLNNELDYALHPAT